MLNTWMPATLFRPSSPTRDDAMAFVFHHIRPSIEQTVVLPNGEWFRIPPGEVSLILGTRDDMFICYKRSGAHVGPGELVQRYAAADLGRYPQTYFTQWEISWKNLFNGPWDVFNGPNRIVVRGIPALGG